MITDERLAQLSSYVCLSPSEAEEILHALRAEREQVKPLADELAEAKEERNYLARGDANNSMAAYRAYREEVDGLRGHLARVDAGSRKLCERNEELRNHNTSLQESNLSLRRQMDMLTARLAEYEDGHAILNASLFRDLREVSRQLVDANEQVEVLAGGIEDFRLELRNARREIDHLQRESAQYRQEARDLAKAHDDRVARNEAAKASLKELSVLQIDMRQRDRICDLLDGKVK